MNNGRDPRNRAAMRTALRVHSQETSDQSSSEERSVVPNPTPQQQGARPGNSALEDTLGEWLNGNHQATLNEVQRHYDCARTELSVVYDAWQYENRQNTRLMINNQLLRAEAARYQAVIERIMAEFPEVANHYTVESSESIDLTDDEINEIIDLTAETDEDDDMSD